MMICKKVELKQQMAKIFNEDSETKFPASFTFSRGIEFPKYKITIEEIDEDFFIDSKGTKWIKSN